MLASPVNIVSTENIFQSGCSYLKLSPGSSYPLAMDGGSYVVYPQVRTIDSANGWTDHFYTFQNDAPPGGFPMAPPSDYRYGRGRLIWEKIYDKNGTLLKKTTNTWTYGIEQTQLGIRSKTLLDQWYNLERITFCTS